MDFELLNRLTQTPGLPGREEQVREVLREALDQTGREINFRVDPLGSLIGRVKGGMSGPRIALMAHLDEVGFFVSKVEDSGFLRVIPAGGVDPRVFWAQRVTVHGRRDLPGIVGSVPPHLQPGGDNAGKEAVPIEECFIDLALPGEEVAQLVALGDPVTFAAQPFETETGFCAKALDDRVGLFTMIEALRAADELDCELTVIGSTQEEYGLRGAGPAAFGVDPEIVLVLEGTVAMDVPGLKLPPNLTPTTVGKGPEIRLTDGRLVADRRLADHLTGLAKEMGIPAQVIVKKVGTTDATMVQTARAGIRVGAVSVPVRYLHGPIALANKEDIAQTISLVTAFIETASKAV